MKLCPRCSESFADDAGFCPFDGSELARSSDPLVGRTLAARYRLVRPLGSGGMALVYLAKHVMIDRLSAIKVLRRDLAMSASHRERFLREARAVNRINHPNIVEITDLGESDGLVFLVMEYVEGESLIAALRRGRFAWPRAARVASQVASALARAHDVGIIHRDLKPENVLLGTRAGEDFVKLTDFGIAKILDAPALTFSEQRFGTPGYIAPEYAEGAPAGPLGDLYALGVVLYEMLTGAMPFDSRGAALLVAPLREAPVKPSVRAEGIPAELEELVLRLIARQPSDRPRDAFAVVDALGDILRRLAGSARPPPASDDDEGRPSLITTMAEGPAASFRTELTAEIAALPTAEIAARWHGMLVELTRHIDAALAERGDSAGVRRARELSSHATELVTSLERAKATAAEHQSRVDRLETHGRAFRGTLGHAIDALSRDRSRERAHLDAIEARREGIDMDVTLTSGIDAVAREVLVWEQAALEAEEARAHVVDQDLRYQLEALQRQLAGQNEQLDAELSDATGKLEGALSALRRMTGELVRTIEEAASAVGR
jgi:tRNA A-37 threonylcarbamoyl transferase component Bud32